MNMCTLDVPFKAPAVVGKVYGLGSFFPLLPVF